MFRPNWPSSGVQDVMIKNSAVHCNTVFLYPIVVASDYFGYVGYQIKLNIFHVNCFLSFKEEPH
jgi:hypothetical protein